MKIRKLEIRDFGSIENVTLMFSEGLNVLYTEKESVREEIHQFIEDMLFAKAEFPYAGVLWFESGGRNYRLTRNLHGETPYSELLCEENGELLDADRLSESKIALGISETVYENAVCISPLKGNTGSEIVREVQRQMSDFQTTGDRSVDLGRMAQRIKMTRKGYQVQLDRRKKSEDHEKQKISSQITRLRREIRDLEDQKQQIGEQEDALRMNEESNGYQLLDDRIINLQAKNRMQIIGMCLTVILAFTVVMLLVVRAGAILPAVLAAIAGVLLFMAETNFEMRTVRELEKRRRMRSRWIARQEKLKGGRSSLDEELHEKNIELGNLTEELREIEEHAYLLHVEELEIDSLNLAMDTIGKLSDKIYQKTGNRLIESMSETLREITGGSCRELLVDEELHISIDTGKEIVAIENLRLITVGQIYLAMRYAMGELLCSNERLPVLFNEVFGTYDEERLKLAVSYLLGMNRQVIISTGRKKEQELVMKTGLACNVMTL